MNAPPEPDPVTLADIRQAAGRLRGVSHVTPVFTGRHLAGFFTVEEKEIIPAMRFAFERLKLIIEPSSAVALAPLLRHEPALSGKKVGVSLMGGNVDLSEFFEGFPTKASV